MDDDDKKLREVSKEDLKQILAAHAKWVQTERKEGQQANLRAADLQEADLRDADLRGAILVRANLQGANLARANLTKATGLTGKQLDEACGDDKTTLPDYLADYQMKPCPTPEQPTSN